MPNACSITVCGHVGRDAELRKAGDSDVASFSIAHTRKRKDKEWTTWYDVSVFGRQATSVAEYVKKGQPVLVTGECYLDTYAGKDGQQKQTLRLDASSVTFLGGKTGDGERPKDKAATAAQAPGTATGDVPFAPHEKWAW